MMMTFLRRQCASALHPTSTAPAHAKDRTKEAHGVAALDRLALLVRGKFPRLETDFPVMRCGQRQSNASWS